jgi:hypothetical protein
MNNLYPGGMKVKSSQYNECNRVHVRNYSRPSSVLSCQDDARGNIIMTLNGWFYNVSIGEVLPYE